MSRRGRTLPGRSIEHATLSSVCVEYLTSLLPKSIEGHARNYLIRGYHDMSSQEYRKESIEALRDGTETRILLCTDTGAFGIDIQEVERVVVAEMSPTFKTQNQRIGRIRGSGTAIICYPSWMSLSDKSKSGIKSRAKVKKVMVDFANASQECCPRRVACLHWGEPFTQPQPCCNLHDPCENS